MGWRSVTFLQILRSASQCIFVSFHYFKNFLIKILLLLDPLAIQCLSSHQIPKLPHLLPGHQKKKGRRGKIAHCMVCSDDRIQLAATIANSKFSLLFSSRDSLLSFASLTTTNRPLLTTRTTQNNNPMSRSQLCSLLDEALAVIDGDGYVSSKTTIWSKQLG
jgi:hypothetical protein